MSETKLTLEELNTCLCFFKFKHALTQDQSTLTDSDLDEPEVLASAYFLVGKPLSLPQSLVDF